MIDDFIKIFSGLKLTLQDGNSKFIVECENIVFTSGGSLDSLPEGMLELNLEFTAINKAVKYRGTDETDEPTNYGGETPTQLIVPVTEEISFTIREG